MLEKRAHWALHEIDWRAEPDLSRFKKAQKLIKFDPVRALPELESLANQGSVMSMVGLGDLLQRGISGIPKDLSLAETWYRKAAEAGSLFAMFSLARLYLRLKDYGKASEFLEAGVLKNHPPSMFWLAVVKLQRGATPQDRKRSYTLLEQAASFGHVRAKRQLRVLMIRGHFGIRKILTGLRTFPCVPVEIFWIARKNRWDERLL